MPMTARRTCRDMWLLRVARAPSMSRVNSARLVDEPYENRFEETPFRGRLARAGTAGWGRTTHTTRRTNALRPPLRTLAVLVASTALVTGCSSADDWSGPHPKPTAVGALGAGFVDASSSPAPESTTTPRPGSWTGVHPPKGYRVVLVSAGDDRPTKALVTAVEDWAEAEHADLRTVRADGTSDLL